MTTITDADRKRLSQYMVERARLAFDGTTAPHADLLLEMFARHREAALEEAAKGQWFYADGYQSDECRFSPSEAIEDVNPAAGYHVIKVDVAKPLPSIWCAVHVRTNEEMDALETDDRVEIIECASEDAAETAIREMKGNNDAG